MLRHISKRLYSSAAGPLLRTPLYDIHVALGGKMVPYAGFEMPVMYSGQSHIESHNWVRNQAGLFDVSHMLQHKISGPGATAFLEKITPADLKTLKPFTSTLSVLLNEEGGIIDDSIITKHGHDEFYFVTNAGCREKDVKFLRDQMDKHFPNAKFEYKNFEGTLLALQGPKAAATLQEYTNFDLSKLYFGQSAYLNLSGFCSDKVHVARSGYTGEDGFEISIPHAGTCSVEFARALLEDNKEVVKPIGLAARDSLRLEAGMCLYGYELSEQTTPIEAALAWLVPKSRRLEYKEGDLAAFNGHATILGQLKDRTLVKQQRVGLVSKGPSPREGSKIFDASGEKVIGTITSGSPSPTNGGNVAQGYVDRGAHKNGTPVKIEIRGKLRDGVIAKMPFVEPHYYKE
ncbi:hypothetical protein BABINDRAFT_161845 [Babjeviella inositovora NRRL Y-12698]|uniref:Aminomethyltransferase n=1 Tax=Babjeviella inositovora NRRL Y-12698 TaxID=984486 RepID=A0A1E3QPQ4_9ASCO|nr:uncharacterized protein BABINDRAFT_161845 [Babjeviella inositovora NRRL Y-12698]ODQ79444.1 hypothetical protein BABINDRAFT_161845 [Babjeviella inositovora NRRL Y-12698]